MQPFFTMMLMMMIKNIKIAQQKLPSTFRQHLVNVFFISNILREKSKQLAEQGAAMSCLTVLGEKDGRLNDPQNEDEELRRKWRKIVSEERTTDIDNKDRSYMNNEKPNYTIEDSVKNKKSS